MYHVKNDKRSFASSELIYQGLAKCMKSKDFEQITVSDIQRASSVGRATFYRSFDVPFDVLCWKCNQCFQNMMNNFLENEEANQKPSGFVRFALKYWMEQCDIIEQLLSINRVDIFYEAQYEYSFSITDYYKKVQSLPDGNYDYGIAIRSGILIGILVTWIRKGKQENARELQEILISQLEFIKDTKVYF